MFLDSSVLSLVGFSLSLCFFFIEKKERKEGKRVLVSLLCPTLCDPQTVACQAPLSMEISRQEYWSGLPFPSPGDHPNSGIEPRSPALQADSLLSEPPVKPPFS